jgi:SAM-dependent methyltransferase
MLALCATRARPVPLVMADLWERLPFEDASFDAVIALHGTLAHAPSEAARVAFPHEVARVLRPGGVFLAEVPTDAWVDALPPGASLVPFGGGKARFVDPKTGASVDVWASSPEGWRALFATSLPSRVEPGLPGEARLVARKRLADHPSSDVTGPGDSSAQDDAGRGKVAAGHR